MLLLLKVAFSSYVWFLKFWYINLQISQHPTTVNLKQAGVKSLLHKDEQCMFPWFPILFFWPWKWQSCSFIYSKGMGSLKFQCLSFIFIGKHEVWVQELKENTKLLNYMRRLFVFRKAETGFSAGKGTDSQSKPVLPHSLVNFTHIHRHMITHIHTL